MTRIFLPTALLFLFVLGAASIVSASGTETGGGEPTGPKALETRVTLPGEMIILGSAAQNGVQAMAHLKDVKKAMTELGNKATHHLMVVFVDQKTGEMVEAGSAAVKFSYGNQNPGKPVPLIAMQGHFGADLNLKGPGEYQFVIDSQLADNKKRQFLFDFTLK